MTTALSGRKLGINSGAPYRLAKCPMCQKERYVPIRSDRSDTPLCRECFERKPYLIEVLEVKSGRELGYHGKDRYGRIVCPKCLKERWIRLGQAKKVNGLCRSCSSSRPQLKGEASPHWKGGRSLQADGYVYIFLSPDSPYFSMAEPTRNYILEHRLVMAKYLGRCLESSEIVHHINGKRDDNRIDNLRLVDRHTHPFAYKDAYAEGYNAGIVTRDRIIEKEIRLLRWQIKELTKSVQLHLEVRSDD